MQPGRHSILFYDYVEDIAERRGPVRPAHLEHIGVYRGDGRIVAAGATGDPVSGAVIVFSENAEAQIPTFVAADPYVVAGLVTAWRVVPWTVVA